RGHDADGPPPSKGASPWPSRRRLGKRKLPVPLRPIAAALAGPHSAWRLESTGLAACSNRELRPECPVLRRRETGPQRRGQAPAFGVSLRVYLCVTCDHLGRGDLLNYRL